MSLSEALIKDCFDIRTESDQIVLFTFSGSVSLIYSKSRQSDRSEYIISFHLVLRDSSSDAESVRHTFISSQLSLNQPS